MSRLRHLDILVEMVDLSHDLIQEIRQQLCYYRASVYKDETAYLIQSKIAHLRLVCSLFQDEHIKDCFEDFDAVLCATGNIPGECSLSKRVGALLKHLDTPLADLNKQLMSRAAGVVDPQEFTATIRAHRDQLIALCQHGSRQWSFFQSL